MLGEPLTLTTILDYCKRCEENNHPITIMTLLPDTPKAEMITNPPENIPAKMKYFKEVYNEDLSHKYSTGVYIVGYLEMESQTKELVH